METFKGKINEFIDWTTGVNELTGNKIQGVSDQTPISGQSIRELLLSRLKTPFVKYDDPKRGQYIFFSSEDARDEWLRLTNTENPSYSEESAELATRLPITTMPRPADTAIVVRPVLDNGVEVNSDTAIGNSRYILADDPSSSEADIKYTVRMFKEAGGSQQATVDSFSVTYTITDANGGKYISVDDYDSDKVTSGDELKVLSFNCFSHITEGANNVSLHVASKNSGAVFDIDIPIYLVRFTISSTFNFSGSIQHNSTFSVPFSVNRSVSGMKLTVKAEICDGSLVNKVFVPVADHVTTNSDNPYTYSLNITNIFPPNESSLDHILHTLLLYATLEKSGSSVNGFQSNTLVYNFETSSPNSNVVNKFINICYNAPANKLITNNGIVTLYATQYEPFSMGWAYYTDHSNYESSMDVSWYLRYYDGLEYLETLIGGGSGNRSEISDPLRFIPDVYQTESDNARLIAKRTDNGLELGSFPIIIEKSTYDVQETSDARFKISAFGKSNQSNDRDRWVDSIGGAESTFTNIPFDNGCGWSDDSLIVQGSGRYVTIGYNPFELDGSGNETLGNKGRTIEIEFTPIKSNNDNDVLIRIGNPTNGHIDIKPNGAFLYNGGSTADIIHTNYKVGERIKLAFVFNTTNTNAPENGLIYIINNGVLERAASIGVTNQYGAVSGNIVIGGTDSGVKVYNMRIYNKPLTPMQELNNYIYDASDKPTIISRNQLFENGRLDFKLVKNKIDSILIEGLSGKDPSGKEYGGLDKILTRGITKEDSETTVNIRRTCVSDDTKSFYILKALIRKHGQSTLNYPITALKFWFNKSSNNPTNDVPTFNELSETQQVLNLNKNRYIMKAGAIPANKFVLLANYADSSGTHNGSLLRLILDTWYGATFSKERNEHKLRTAPQLFTSGETVIHNNEDLYEHNHPWTDGYGVNLAANKTWPQLTGKDFPYTIRNSADSFPCAVFYKNPNEDEYEHFLGQYVFMDDKKSDFIYGERSIYAFGDYTDPFVMNTDNTKNGKNGKLDVDENKVWDNSNVLRIEIVLPNTNVTSYMGMDVPTNITLDDDGNIIESQTSANTIDCREIKYDDKGNALKFYWEDYFEMIYPDPDDVEYEEINKVDVYTKFEEDSKFRRTAKPFIDFLEWITGLAALNVHDVGGQDKQYIDGTVKLVVLERFINEAHLHLDLHKLAAYYIFFLRFGLVDSVERNAQLKTYDGQHWHYEPWDMDIALGNTNQGALVLNPPLDRNSVIPGTSTKAFSGRGESTSNFLWDCLEAWPAWRDKLVPDVAEALYKAGLTYENAIKVFDGEYSDKWAESLYNEAGYFKYIKHGGGDYLPWLQGSRLSHRHWWLSTSMNYYDSKWACGTFKDKRVILFVDKGIHTVGTDIVRIKPTANTYFEITATTGTSTIEKKSASPTNQALFDISQNSFSAKDPTWIYGGLFIEELDLSCFAKTMATVDVSLCYDKVLGANIKYLNIGVPTTEINETSKVGSISGTSLRLSAVNSSAGTDALEQLITLDVTGQSTIINTAGIFTQNDRSSIRNFYAAGTSIIAFENAPSGNTFDNLILPATTQIINADNSTSDSSITTLVMHSASWNTLEFWNTNANSIPTQVFDENNEPVLVNGEPVYIPASAEYTKLSTIPSSLMNVTFDGSTARSEASLLFILNWRDSIAATLSSYNQLTGTYDRDELHEELKTRKFIAENINWTNSFSTRVTYDDLEDIAYFNGVDERGVFYNYRYKYIKGYVIITGGLTAEQMVNVKKWFGEEAFNKNAIKSLLVVDSTSNTVVINIDNATIVNGSVHITEGTTASMLGTKFLLGDASGENYTIGQELLVTGNKLIWAIADGTNFSLQNPATLNWGSTFKSCKLQLSQSGDGRMLLVAEPGIYNDYYLAIRVTFINDQQLIDHAYLVVYIEGVTYPTGYLLNVAGSGKRAFNVDNVTYLNIFGTNYSTYGNLSIPTYVLHTANQLMDVSIIPEGTFTAQVTLTSFKLIKILNGVGTTITSGGYLDIAEVNSANYAQMLTLDSNDLVGYNSNGGNQYTISIVAGPNLSSVQTCAAYLLLLLIKIGARTENRAVNIVVLDDSLAVLMSSISNGTYLVLSNKYGSLYGPINSRNLYKTDLMGITGTVDFTGNISNTTSLVSSLSNGDSVLKYLPNVTGLNFAGCVNIQDQASIFDFSYCTKLTSLNISGCTGLSLNVLDLKECTNLQSLNTENTNIGVILGDASTNSGKKSQIGTLNLGSPNKLIIDGATTLTSSGVSITSSSNLTELLIKNVNDNNVCGYTLFDTIYNPQQSNNQSS